MQGLMNPTVPYILERDRDIDVPEEQKTIWHVKIFTPIDTSLRQKRLSRAYKIGGGQREPEMDEIRHQSALKADWCEAITKVENYHFGIKYTVLYDKGWIKEITDKDSIKKIFEEIPEDVRVELMNVAEGKYVKELDTIGGADPLE